jgi:hypothetical protein
MCFIEGHRKHMVLQQEERLDMVLHKIEIPGDTNQTSA